MKEDLDKNGAAIGQGLGGVNQWGRASSPHVKKYLYTYI